MSWSKKPKVLVVGDSSCIHTGFARVIKTVCTHLYKTNNYDLKTIGWFHRATDEIVPYEIIQTKRDSRQVMEEDKYSAKTFPEVIDKFKPDVVLAVGDSWMIEHIAKCPLRPRYKLVLYVPIDGLPIPEKWTETFALADVTVAYGKFGKAVMLSRNPNLKNIAVINHGVDTDIFKPVSGKGVEDIKAQLTKGEEGTFVIGCVARNQPRKGLPRLFKAIRLFMNPWATCKDCGELFIDETDSSNYNECSVCGSKNLHHGEPKENIRLYLHMAIKDCGWDIIDLIKRFDMCGKVAYPRGLEIGRGVEIRRLNEIMNTFDVFTLPTTGEGWGLPILEAMSAGLPTLVTDYSAHVEFCSGAAETIAVGEFVCEPMTNIERAYVDTYDYAMKLDRMYMEDKNEFLNKWGKHIEVTGSITESDFLIGKKFRDKLSHLARERALQYTWDRVNGEWEQLLNSVLKYNPEDVVIETKVEYEVEEV
jgi:glycosyltransferase involved in cell wall biosynthesis